MLPVGGWPCFFFRNPEFACTEKTSTVPGVGFFLLSVVQLTLRITFKITFKITVKITFNITFKITSKITLKITGKITLKIT